MDEIVTFQQLNGFPDPFKLHDIEFTVDEVNLLSFSVSKKN